MELPKLVNFNPYNKEKLPRLVLDVWGEGTFDYGSNPWGYIEDPELVEAVEQAIESGEYVKYTQEGRSSYIKKGRDAPQTALRSRPRRR